LRLPGAEIATVQIDLLLGGPSTITKMDALLHHFGYDEM
jgi:hypothetical protein